jgi:hypothetical protein
MIYRMVREMRIVSTGQVAGSRRSTLRQASGQSVWNGAKASLRIDAQAAGRGHVGGSLSARGARGTPCAEPMLQAGDKIFWQLVLARVIESANKQKRVLRVLKEAWIDAMSYATVKRRLT